ncbi:MAG: YkgJ family cysteine cluster protein [Bacillota bacterium]
MLSLDKLYTQLSYAEKNGLLDGLNSIYGGLPETVCERCGTCCTVPPPAYIVEYLNMFRYMKNSLGEKEIQDIVGKAVRFYFLELVDINLKCPFLGDDNLCLVYPARPLSCRGYGLSKKEGRLPENNEMKELAERYKRDHGITLPEEIVNYKLPECGRVKTVDGKKYSNEALEVAISYIARLESQIFPVELVEREYTFVPYVTHLAVSVLPEGARMRRVKVMKEYLDKGNSQMLEGYIEKARALSV